MKLLPIIGPQATWLQIMRAGMRGHAGSGALSASLAALLLDRDAGFLCVNSGLAAWYLILLELKEKAPLSRREIVLPAYTAGSLVVAVQAAGLVPVLCDISLDDFNASRDAFFGALSGSTLAALAVHMFGIPAAWVVDTGKNLPAGAALIEDCAQAQGSLIGKKPVGSFAEVSFWSFNRGKNMSLATGGALSARGEFLASCRSRLEHLAGSRRTSSLAACVKSLALSLASRPRIYGTAYPFLSRYKDRFPPRGVHVGFLSAFQAALAREVLAHAGCDASARRNLGLRMLSVFSGIAGVRCARPGRETSTAFNRFPVLIEDATRIPGLIRGLRRAGIESARLYERPLHRMFRLGYAGSEFPQACYLAEHLITLPSHPGVAERDIDAMADILKNHRS